MDLVSSRRTLGNFNKALLLCLSLSLWFLVWLIASCLEENQALVLPTIASKLYLHTEAVIFSTTFMDSSLKFQESMSLPYVPFVEVLGVLSGKLSSSHQSLLLFWMLIGSWFLSFSAAVNSVNGEKVTIKKIGNAFDNIIDAKRNSTWNQASQAYGSWECKKPYSSFLILIFFIYIFGSLLIFKNEINSGYLLCFLCFFFNLLIFRPWFDSSGHSHQRYCKPSATRYLSTMSTLSMS